MNSEPRKLPQGLTSYTLAALCDRMLNGEQSAEDVRTLALAVHDLIAADDDEITELKTRLAEYEGAICWDTACLSCSSVLDKSYEEYVRADRAERARDRYRLAWESARRGRRTARADAAWVRELHQDAEVDLQWAGNLADRLADMLAWQIEAHATTEGHKVLTAPGCQRCTMLRDIADLDVLMHARARIKASAARGASEADAVTALRDASSLAAYVEQRERRQARADQGGRLMSAHREAFCWQQPPGRAVACDRAIDHLGPHSWEFGDVAPVRPDPDRAVRAFEED